MTPSATNTPPKTNTEKVHLRVLILAGILSACLVGLAYKAYAIQIAEGPRYRELGKRQYRKQLKVASPRATIVDRSGDELAVTVGVNSAFADPKLVVDIPATAKYVARVLDLDPRAVEDKLALKNRFVWLRRHITEEQALLLKKTDLPGIALRREPKRYYPNGRLAATLIGVTGIDGNGLSGIELALDTALSGAVSKYPAVRDARGRLLVAEPLQAPLANDHVRLTLDRYIQHIAEQAIERAVVRFSAKGGTAVVLDVATANVLAIADYPTFDLNRREPDETRAARNRAVTDAYEIGSVMKTFTIAAALELGLVSPTTQIDVQHGQMRIYDKVIRDSFTDDILSVSEVLKRSSNVGAVKIARIVSAERLREALLKYGFASKTGIELPGERKGFIRPAKRWGKQGLASISFGYNLTVTPLQIAAAFAAIGNDGIYTAPRIVATTPSETAPQGNTHKQIMSPRVARQVRKMLASVFEGGKRRGTASKLKIPGFRAGGKTGTAKKVDPITKGYSDELYLASFAGLAPIDDPRIAVVVIVDEPHGEHYGAKVAGPAFAEIVSRSLSYLKLPATESLDSDDSRKRPVASPGRNQVSPSAVATSVAHCETTTTALCMPDVTGQGVQQSLAAVKHVCSDISISGSGSVVDQKPAPGSVNARGTCRLTFASRE